ncbi:MAG: Zn-ribbon domain-containing OB-fold protein [Crenarchaeota archaeon]|nr:Zn-ribbon domain-containing OB-fold protein [Thermoproteota archaeon]
MPLRPLSPAKLWRRRLQHYRLEAARCRDCGKTIYPPRPRCPYCGSRNLEKLSLLGKKGKLVTYTVEYTVPAGFREQAPLVIGIAEIEGARILASMTDVDPEELRTGMCVEPVLRRIRSTDPYGVIAYAVKLRPCLGAGHEGGEGEAGGGSKGDS